MVVVELAKLLAVRNNQMRLKIGEGLEFAKRAYSDNLYVLMEALNKENWIQTGNNLDYKDLIVYAMSMYVEALEKEKMVRVDKLTGEIIIE